MPPHDELDELHDLLRAKEWLRAKTMARRMLLEVDTSYFLRPFILRDIIKVCDHNLKPTE